MGYYASGYGELSLISEIPEDVLKSIAAFDEADQYTRSDGSIWLALNHYDDKYSEDRVLQDLDLIRHYVRDGSIDFKGEDDCIWRFRFDPDRGVFVEENGTLVYDYSENGPQRYSGDRLEFISSIIEVFETFLDERGIEIQNDEKQQDDHASNIYGTDYGDLESELEALLIKSYVLAPN